MSAERQALLHEDLPAENAQDNATADVQNTQLHGETTAASPVNKVTAMPTTMPNAAGRMAQALARLAWGRYLVRTLAIIGAVLLWQLCSIY